MTPMDLPRRSLPRCYVGQIVIAAATAVALGVALRQPTFMGANDVSRWCTVWSLLERGSYVIDDCPWRFETQDKVYRAPKNAALVDGGPPVKHYYSSKPALLPTLIAAILYPVRKATGVPLDAVVLQPRATRWTQHPDPSSPLKVKGVLETPPEPVRWPVYVFYLKPIVILCNVIPFAVYLTLFARVLDRAAGNDWAWFFAISAAAFGTYLLPFNQTLNNHTIAAYSGFFAVYPFLRIWDQEQATPWRFAAVGFFAAFATTNELPALALFASLGGCLLIHYPRKTLLYFTAGAAVPLVAFAAAQYAVFGEFKLAYESFGGEEYLYEGSFWKTPLELDAFNDHPEPYSVYLLHMTLGHHGFFSLTPVFLFSLWGAIRLIWQGGFRSCGLFRRPPQSPPLAIIAWITLLVTAVLLAFYTWNPKARNYGGSTQGLRWLFWIIPLWMLLLARGVEGGGASPLARRLALLALVVSAVSVGYAMRNPWTHPWILDAMEHLNLYPLSR